MAGITPQTRGTNVKFAMIIDLENQAFDGETRGDELGRIMDDVRELVLCGNASGKIKDSNGNAVGEWSIK